MEVKPMKPVSRVMADDVLVASIVRCGNGRSASPVRWVPYWSLTAERLGAPPAHEYFTRHEAEAEALLFARRLKSSSAPRVDPA